MKLIAVLIAGLAMSGLSGVAVVQTMSEKPPPVTEPLVVYGER